MAGCNDELSLARLEDEYLVDLQRQCSTILKIRLIPGMEMLAQELNTARRVYEPDWLELPPIGSPAEKIDAQYHGAIDPNEQLGDYNPPSPSPMVDSPEAFFDRVNIINTSRRRSGHFHVDTTGSFPIIYIERDKVCFYSNKTELDQALTDYGDEGLQKLIINIANVVSIEKLVSYQGFAQNMTLPDVAEHGQGGNHQPPPLAIRPLSIDGSLTVPVLSKPEDEMFMRIPVSGGIAPYRYYIYGQPDDLYVTTDGWLRGHIMDEVWPKLPATPVEFMMRIIVEDSSVPVQTAVIDLRYRLNPI